MQLEMGETLNEAVDIKVCMESDAKFWVCGDISQDSTE
jgi:hypothetical protein